MSDLPSATIGTLADLMEGLGRIPLERVRLHPAPGTATEADVLARPQGVKRLLELVDGVLVEKAMGFYESRLAAVLIVFLADFLKRRDLGIVLGADATFRLAAGLVRIPDVAFISWERFPDRKLPPEPIPDVAPDLAVEVLSQGNTRAEMERKLREYFAAGARVVWYLDPEKRVASVFTSPEDMTEVDEDGVLDGGEILPGFRLPVREWFAAAGERRPS
jgi:Uma2 family endonuclease